MEVGVPWFCDPDSWSRGLAVSGPSPSVWGATPSTWRPISTPSSGWWPSLASLWALVLRLCGQPSAPTWHSLGVWYSKITKQSEDAVINKFFGFFFMMFQTSGWSYWSSCSPLATCFFYVHVPPPPNPSLQHPAPPPPAPFPLNPPPSPSPNLNSYRSVTVWLISVTASPR